jgi:hypothetical protein
MRRLGGMVARADDAQRLLQPGADAEAGPPARPRAPVRDCRMTAERTWIDTPSNTALRRGLALGLVVRRSPGRAISDGSAPGKFAPVLPIPVGRSYRALGRHEAIRRLDAEECRLERARPAPGFDAFLTQDRADSWRCEGRRVAGVARPPRSPAGRACALPAPAQTAPLAPAVVQLALDLPPRRRPVAHIRGVASVWPDRRGLRAHPSPARVRARR